MSAFLKIFSAFCLVLIWLPAVLFFFIPTAGLPATVTPDQLAMAKLVIIAVAIVSSVAPVALYAFGRMVGDVRAVRDHLAAMRQYYEPDQRFKGL